MEAGDLGLPARARPGIRIHAADGRLIIAPCHEGTDLLLRQSGKHEERKTALPGERLRLVEGKPRKPGFEAGDLGEFALEGRPGLADGLRDGSERTL